MKKWNVICIMIFTISLYILIVIFSAGSFVFNAKSESFIDIVSYKGNVAEAFSGGMVL